MLQPLSMGKDKELCSNAGLSKGISDHADLLVNREKMTGESLEWFL